MEASRRRLINRQWFRRFTVAAAVCVLCYSLFVTVLRTPEPIRLDIAPESDVDGVRRLLQFVTVPFRIGMDSATWKYYGQWSVLEKTRETCCYGRNITLASAYFNIGDFAKGQADRYRKRSEYLQWLSGFRDVNQCVIFYSNDVRFVQEFLELRHHLPNLTVTVFIPDARSLWSFSLREEIHEIYVSPSYPHHYPNTYLATYSCAMHAKYEILGEVTRENYFNTTHVAWVDSGLFRFIERDHGEFYMDVPAEYDGISVAFTQYNHFRDGVMPMQIVRQNMVWVCGGYFMAKLDAMAKFVEFYKFLVTKLISAKLMSTDQQVVYVMFTSDIAKSHAISLQAFTSRRNYTGNLWAVLPFYSSPQVRQLYYADVTVKPEADVHTFTGDYQIVGGTSAVASWFNPTVYANDEWLRRSLYGRCPSWYVGWICDRMS